LRKSNCRIEARDILLKGFYDSPLLRKWGYWNRP